MAYWMSYTSNCQDSLQRGRFGHGCMISVVLDAGAHEFFAGIRLVVVSDNENLKNITLKKCLEPTNKYNICEEGSLSTYRQLLSRRERDVKQYRKHTLPLCEVVLELVEISMGTGTAVGLVPPLLSSTGPRRIFYEQIYSCPPAQHSFVTYLDSSSSFGHCSLQSMLGVPIPAVYRKPLAQHNIRIIPINTTRPQLVTLPDRVLRHVVRCAFEQKYIGWRKDLLAISLVCKSWSHVLDIFFSDLPSYADSHGPNVITVARSLDARPDRAALIRNLCSTAFEHDNNPEDEVQMKRSQAIVSILRRATSVKKVWLRDIHESNVSAAIDALSQLREMEEFSVLGHSIDFLRNKDWVVTMSDLLRGVANSRALRKIYITGWHYPGDAEPVDEPNTNLVPQPTKLEDVFLNYGQISRLQLLHFASPRLREACLISIAGLVNTDLFAFLSQVAPTLEKFVISSTNAPRTSTDEEYALDAVIPRLVNLTYLQFSSDLASGLVLMRKLASPSGKMAKVCFMDVRTNVVWMDSIIAAAEVTRWDELAFFCDSESAWDEDAVAQVEETGEKRRVKFRFYNQATTN